MNSRGKTFFTLAALLAATPPALHAQSLLYPDFSSASLAANPSLTLNGEAAPVNDVLRLTTNNYDEAGSAFSTLPISLNSQESFSTEFSFNLNQPGGISDEDGPGADGFVFVLQTVSNDVGSDGIGIGYSGLTPSIGVAFDTFDDNINFSNPPDDLDGNHVAVFEDGDIYHGDALAYRYADTGGAPDFPTRFNNSEPWYAWVDYNGATEDLEVRYNSIDVRPTDPFVSVSNLDLASVLGQSSAFVGFTAATGAAYENQDITSWQFINSYSPIGVPATAVPESDPLPLLVLGLGGIVLMARRRRSA